MSQQRPMARPAGGGPRMGFGGPPAKSKDFKGSLKRLLSELGNERKLLYVVLA